MKIEIRIGRLPWQQEHQILHDVKEWAQIEFKGNDIHFIKTNDPKHEATFFSKNEKFIQAKSERWTVKMNENIPHA